jgi:hypothetical protein
MKKWRNLRIISSNLRKRGFTNYGDITTKKIRKVYF